MKPTFFLSSIAAVAAVMVLAPGAFAASSPAPSPALAAGTSASLFSAIPQGAGDEAYAQAIYAVGRKMPAAQQSALEAWMTGPKPAQFKDSQWLYLRNVALDSLCEQTAPLPNLSELLVSIANDKVEDSGIRDYAIQHMVDRLQPMGVREPCENDPKKRGAMLNTMLDAAGNASGDLAGTALQSLHLVLEARQYAEAHKLSSAQAPLSLAANRLRPLAVGLATATGAPMKTQMTALDVCAERGFSEALPVSRSIVKDQKQPVTLRLSAIAALGELGDSSDEALLRSLGDGPDHQFLKAVQPALTRIAQRRKASVPQ